MIHKYRSLLKLNTSRQLYKPYVHRQLYKPINNLFNSFYELKEVIIIDLKKVIFNEQNKQKLLEFGKKFAHNFSEVLCSIPALFAHIIYCFMMSFGALYIINIVLRFLEKHDIIKLPPPRQNLAHCKNCRQIYDAQQK